MYISAQCLVTSLPWRHRLVRQKVYIVDHVAESRCHTEMNQHYPVMKKLKKTAAAAAAAVDVAAVAAVVEIILV